MTALRDVFTRDGLPIALYTDRAGWAFYTPTAGGKVDRTRPTQIGRALQRLGIEHIPSYSPQGRGRSERLNRTLQGRVINELALAGIRTADAANVYLRERFLPAYNEEFAHRPADATPAFIPLHDVDLDQILCHEELRTVGQDNVVTLERLPLQLPRQPGRRTCAGLQVLVRRHLSGQHSVWHGLRCLGYYDAAARPLPPPRGLQPPRPKNARAHLAQDRRAARRPGVPVPPPAAPSRRRSGPRFPTGPRP